MDRNRLVIDLTGLKFWGSLVIMLAAVVGIAWGMVSFVGERVFESELQRFHTVAQPAIIREVDERIERARLSNLQERTSQLAQINEKLGRIDQHSIDVDARLSRIENLLLGLRR